jgi:hypothetical protein
MQVEGVREHSSRKVTAREHPTGGVAVYRGFRSSEHL